MVLPSACLSSRWMFDKFGMHGVMTLGGMDEVGGKYGLATGMLSTTAGVQGLAFSQKDTPDRST